MTFTFMPPVAAPTAVAAPAAASTAIAVLEPSIIVAAPDDLEEFSMPRHENEFDEENGQCYDCVKTVHEFDCPEFVVRNVQLTDGCVLGRGVHLFEGGCSDGLRVLGRGVHFVCSRDDGVVHPVRATPHMRTLRHAIPLVPCPMSQVANT